jgi:hypothetical protein
LHEGSAEMKDHKWLLSQIRDVQKEMAAWPDWMKKVAHFDGASRPEADAPSLSTRKQENGVSQGTKKRA